MNAKFSIYVIVGIAIAVSFLPLLQLILYILTRCVQNKGENEMAMIVSSNLL